MGQDGGQEGPRLRSQPPEEKAGEEDHHLPRVEENGRVGQGEEEGTDHYRSPENGPGYKKAFLGKTRG